MPNLFIVAGPNGVGKTTYVRRFLPKEAACWEFVNADAIAAGLSPFAAEQATFEAGRIMLNRLSHLVERRQNFTFETTLSGRSYAPLLRQWRDLGYRSRLDFLWMPNLELTRTRVQQRVAKGGHSIPESVQRRRFHLGIRNLAELYRPLLDGWRLYDNTGPVPVLVAKEVDGSLEIVDANRLAMIEASAQVHFMPKSPDSRVEEPPITIADEDRRSMRAMRLAHADAILENLAFGLPVIQWRDGIGVVEVPAKLLEPLARRLIEVNGEPLPPEEEQALLANVTFQPLSKPPPANPPAT